jgi:hypothetical protein
VALTEGKLIVQAGATATELQLGWQVKKWHHLALITSRKRFQASDLHVYVDGNLLHTGKLGSPPRKLPSMSFTVGSAGSASQSSTGDAATPGWVWRAGQLWVLEEDLNETQIATSYCLGPAYKGVFRPPLASHLPARRCSSRRPTCPRAA